MHGQSIFGLPSLHSLYSLISKRCYIFDNPAKKNLLNISSWNDIFTAWMTYSMALASFWGQKYINSWDLTSEAVLRSSEATFQNVLKWFWLHFHTILISKWPRIGLHELSTSLTSEADMEAAEAGLSKWRDFKAYA